MAPPEPYPHVMKLQIVGGGKMGEALLGGVLAKGWATPEDLAIVELSEERRSELSSAYPGVIITTEVDPAADSLIAVKPQHVVDLVSQLAGADVRVLSVAAGVQISAMETAAPQASIIRAMPNTPALVGQGASAIAGGRLVAEADLSWAESILGAVGIVVRVEEADIDAVTGLSGSGPAYVFHLAEGLIAAGIAQGLAPEVSDQLTRQTLLGAATLLSSSGQDPAVLRKNVTSPGGTTEAGLAVFAEADLAALVDRVVGAATDRSKELGQDG